MINHDEAAPRVWRVDALCRALADTLNARFNPVRVSGELSGFSRAASGHCYFSLKDQDAQIRCAMFKRAASQLDFAPRDGELVEVSGRLDIYGPRGDLQLIVESMRKQGQGNLFEEFVRLKNRLESRGLFAQERKRALPLMPRGIGLITSLGAAALHDVATALRRRVLELVWQSHKPLGAYDILAVLSEQDGRRAAPPTVYRALDFLLENSLVHRIASLNAFMGCSHPEHAHQGQFLICRECHVAIELEQTSISDAIVASATDVGFSVEAQTVEVVGLCGTCKVKKLSGEVSMVHNGGISDDDLGSIVAYLRSVSAIDNDPGQSQYNIPLPPAWMAPPGSPRTSRAPRRSAASRSAWTPPTSPASSRSSGALSPRSLAMPVPVVKKISPWGDLRIFQVPPWEPQDWAASPPSARPAFRR